MPFVAPADIIPLVQTLSFFYPQSEKVVAYLQQHASHLRCKRGTLLLRAGMVCEHIYFIRKGTVRGFIIDGGKDITSWITADGEMVTSISGLDMQTPAVENIETLEDCELLVLTTHAVNDLYQLHPEFNITARKLLQQYYRDAEKRAYLSRLSSAEQKYLYFVQHYPHLSNRVPLKYIASFLGITIETLSRVRKKLAS